MIEDPYETKTFWPRRGLTLLCLVGVLAVAALWVVAAVDVFDGRAESAASRPAPRTGALVLLCPPAIVAGAVLLVRRLVRPRPVLVLASSGLTPGSTPEVAWRRISHLSPATIRGNRFLLVHLHDEQGYLQQLNGLRRRLAAANQRLCGASIALNVRDLGLPVERLAAEIEGRRLHFGGG